MLGIFGGGGSGGAGSDVGTHGRLDTTNAELTTLDNDINAGLGTDGSGESPANGSGVRGWLRGIYDKLNGTLTVTAASLPLPTGAATSSAQGTANSSLSSIVTNTAAGATASGQAANATRLDTLHTDLTSTLNVQKKRGATSTLTNPSVGSTSSTALAANANRLEAIIYNNSTVTMYIKHGTTASSTSFNVALAAGGTYVEDVYTGRIDFVLASGSATCAVTEVTV